MPTSCNVPARRRARGGERAFGLVEVIIAVLLLTVVIAAVALAMGGGQSLRGAARLQAAMTESGKNVQESLSQDRAWTNSCTTIGAKCAIAAAIRPDDLKLQDIDGESAIVDTDINHTYAIPTDSDVDLIGDNDRDGVIPDYYRVSVRILPSADVAARYMTTQAKAARTFVTSIDPTGKRLEGSLTVQGCRVTNQIDERMSIQGCTQSSRTDVRMDGCPPQPMAPGWSCTNAWSWVSGAGPSTDNPSPFVSMQRVGLGAFSITSTDGQTFSSTDGSVAKHVNGEVVFQNIPTGNYTFSGLPATSGAGTERWETKEIPAFHGSDVRASDGPSVSVEPGIKSRALVLFRPVPTGRGIDMTFKRMIGNYYVSATHWNTEPVFTKQPTKTYRGINADAYCTELAETDARYNGQGGLSYTVDSCDIIAMAAPNCVKVKSVVHGTEVGEPWGPETRSATTCTYFSQTLRHRYFMSDSYDSDLVKGAPKDADWEIRPAPDYRASRPVSPGSSTFDSRIEYCQVQGHVFGSPLSSDHKRCKASVRIDNLDPGLHGPVLERDNDADTDRALGFQDLTNGGSGAWIFDPMWINTDGSIVSQSAGARGVNPMILMTGKGECYWHAPIWFSGKQESTVCGPCNTMYQNHHIYTGACAVLDKTCLSRRVWEEGDFGTSELHGYATDAEDCHGYGANPWVCNSAPATVLGGNCEPPGPPPHIGPKVYQGDKGTSDTGGGDINSNDFSA
jgi:hypothetical protein